MEHLLNQRVRDIQMSGIRKFAMIAAEYPDAISLTLGQPDFPTPEHIKTAGQTAIANNRTSYTPNAGLPELRAAASAFLSAKYGLSYSPDTEIIVTNGASEALDIALRTILTEGVEVLLPGPIYPGYEPLISLCGAVPVYLDTTETEFRVTAEMVQRALTDKTRCLILPTPSNPTGVVQDADSLQAIAEVLRDRDVFVISDEIYSELLYEGTHASIAAQPAMREKTIVINGLSKSHSMTGWRIGLTFAPAYLTKQMVKVHQYNAACASSISQYAALEALTAGIDDAAPMREEYRQRRDYVCARLLAMGFDLVKPSGAFYLFPSIRKFGLSSFDFATRLLEQARVAVVPGVAFSPLGEGFIRISYASSMEQLQEAMDRLETFMKSL
ncbi:aromatic amino acid aminotransferase [Tumebacillus algifaecis]|uniref:Aminotransferase n=1 Tax=Tumebacillus algifaecis TaxID=1214604 RepID=A0A223D4H8_9BACL|nr:aminotransferase A [Tumebacillus algifaecis]ASS76445.1 aromatic amino acid aminotransferase [Tumebacillus algifaecis]